MQPDQRQPRTHLFTLRLWVETYGDDQGEVRMQVRHVLSGETRYFRAWSEAVAFLLVQMQSLDAENRAAFHSPWWDDQGISQHQLARHCADLPLEPLMRQHPSTVEWYVAESDADWERLCAPPNPDSPPEATPAIHTHHYPQRLLAGVAAILLLLVSAGGWWWRSTQGSAQQAAADVTLTAQQELPAVTPGDQRSATSSGRQRGMDWWYPSEQAQKSPVRSSSLPPDWWYQFERTSRDLRMAVQAAGPEAHLDVELQTIEFQGDQVVARVVTTAQNGTPAYRQTRFYRRTAEGWQQTAPNADLWGPERSVATPYFVYHFRQHDAPAVIAVAPQINELYTTLQRNFGLPIIPTPEKLVIEVSVTEPPGDAAPWFGASERILVPSPAVDWVPVELTDAELLAQLISLLLLEHVLAQASERHAIGAGWQPMVSGLRLWQLWDLDSPLAAWREEVVRWTLYLDLPTSSPGQPFVLPERYAELCAAHRLWLPASAQLGIPLVCSELDREDWFFSSWHPPDPLTRLDQLAVPVPQGWFRVRFPADYPPGQTVALATLIEYAVAAYGHERLPALVAGLGQYDSWETLLPAVYGVSSAEFEAGWQIFLATRYGVP